MAHKPKTDLKTVPLGRLIELLAITDPLGIKRLEGLSPAPDWVKVAPARFETVQDMADRLHMDRSTIPRNCRRVATMVAYMAVAGCTP